MHVFFLLRLNCTGLESLQTIGLSNIGREKMLPNIIYNQWGSLKTLCHYTLVMITL